MKRGSKNGSKPPAFLTGKKLYLRPLAPSDVTDAYVGWLNDPEVNRFLEVRLIPQTYETVLSYVKSYDANDKRYMWGIFPNHAAEPVGTATLYDINRTHGTGEIGLLIGEMACWGKGASGEAMELILAFAFDTLGLRRATGGSYALNHGMNFTFKRLGFSLEGKQRKAYAMSPGSYTDGYRWGILAEEWQARRQPRPSPGSESAMVCNPASSHASMVDRFCSPSRVMNTQVLQVPWPLQRVGHV